MSIDWKKQAIDHAGHALLGVVASLPAAICLDISGWAGVIACVLSALWGGTAREMGQIHNAETKNYWHRDRFIDVAFHAPGGVVVWGIRLLGG